ncbi:hypothetical protein LWI29_002262 [Acer saccharum]|uniref:Uncharacterized protein n=1 Tax=Acer saccharum TaxID=4024 RepID=A0AA39SZD9_ACESA|nr:hypothetical protein LWI29_002262 [Acer saccharum]
MISSSWGASLAFSKGFNPQHVSDEAALLSRLILVLAEVHLYNLLTCDFEFRFESKWSKRVHMRKYWMLSLL